jgi:hypothetical protein
MSGSRDNHYVPIWYQEGFTESGRVGLAYLDLAPPVRTLADGRTYTAKSRFPNAAPARCFHQQDLYTTFFGPVVNVEIERLLFGKLDFKGSAAVRAFIGTDVGEWHRQFQAFFQYLDIQKIRTPKGLAWLRLHYPQLTQNQLMTEMQGVRMMHCTLWTEGVREIVSAEDAGVKFIISDHPITICNHALPPEHELCVYPNEPQIALKASQTIYPLNRNFCLILTNLEYAKDPESVDPTSKRTFPKNFRTSMTRTDAFIRTRKLTDAEVASINFILKSRANRYIAAGKEEWLYAEKLVKPTWAELRYLLRPKDDLWQFGGEMFAKFESGEVYYQDQFGRTERQRTFLQKSPPTDLHPNDDCGCGSGRKFKKCCKGVDVKLRASWSELSIRERNLMYRRALIDILGLNRGKSWSDARRDLTDEQIAEAYSLFEGLWPIETDLIGLLPKPDGRTRALYTGLIDPPMVMEFVVGATLYFGEILVQNPFLHPRFVRPEFSPTKSPHLYRQEFLKSALTVIEFGPLIDRGLINLFPDPGYFDHHLLRQMMDMASSRLGSAAKELRPDYRAMWAAMQDMKRTMLYMPEESKRARLRKQMPELPPDRVEAVIQAIERLKEDDALAILQAGGMNDGKEGGLMLLQKMAPNFEVSLFLAQATGSFILTDSRARWTELLMAHRQQLNGTGEHLNSFKTALEGTTVPYPLGGEPFFDLYYDKRAKSFQELVHDVYTYLSEVPTRGARPHKERVFSDRLKSANAGIQRMLRKTTGPMIAGRLLPLMPVGGLGHPNVNRMLLTSGVDHYLERVPMAFLMERTDPNVYRTAEENSL